MSEETKTFFSLVKENVPLIIAVYGVIQVWIIALWKKYLKKGKLKIFETGVVEIGYGGLGPTIGINGTLRAVNKDIFVSSMSLELTRLKDGLFHVFEWAAFRSTKVNPIDPRQITLELASGFIVPVNQPHRYQVVFRDRQVMSEIEPTLIEVRLAWQQFLLQKDNEIRQALSSGVPHTVVLNDLCLNNFQKFPEHVNAWDLLQRKNYWEPGSYRIRMFVNTSGPDNTFSKEWLFELDKRSTDSLLLNSIATLQELCLGQSNYQFAYPQYKNIEPDKTNSTAAKRVG
jgi:hypothetical protein